jgi:hypothetical protein
MKAVNSKLINIHQLRHDYTKIRAKIQAEADNSFILWDLESRQSLSKEQKWGRSSFSLALFLEQS